MSWWDDFSGWFGSGSSGNGANNNGYYDAIVQSGMQSAPSGMTQTPYYDNGKGGFTAYEDMDYVPSSQRELDHMVNTVYQNPNQEIAYGQNAPTNKPAGYSYSPMQAGGMASRPISPKGGDNGNMPVKNWGDEMAMSALEHYKDMSDWAQQGQPGLLNMVLGSGNRIQTQDPYEEFMKIKGLLGGW